MKRSTNLCSLVFSPDLNNFARCTFTSYFFCFPAPDVASMQYCCKMSTARPLKSPCSRLFFLPLYWPNSQRIHSDPGGAVGWFSKTGGSSVPHDPLSCRLLAARPAACAAPHLLGPKITEPPSNVALKDERTKTKCPLKSRSRRWCDLFCLGLDGTI